MVDSCARRLQRRCPTTGMEGRDTPSSVEQRSTGGDGAHSNVSAETWKLVQPSGRFAEPTPRLRRIGVVGGGRVPDGGQVVGTPRPAA